jgi:hypothetical protein
VRARDADEPRHIDPAEQQLLPALGIPRRGGIGRHVLVVAGVRLEAQALLPVEVPGVDEDEPLDRRFAELQARLERVVGARAHAQQHEALAGVLAAQHRDGIGDVGDRTRLIRMVLAARAAQHAVADALDFEPQHRMALRCELAREPRVQRCGPT